MNGDNEMIGRNKARKELKLTDNTKETGGQGSKDRSLHAKTPRREGETTPPPDQSVNKRSFCDQPRGI
jgi:hypothetical protein